MRTTLLRTVAVCGLMLMPLSAHALEYMADSFTPEAAPDFAPLWQKVKVERGDTHWDVARDYALASGMIAEGRIAPESRAAQIVFGLMQTIFNSPLNQEAKWDMDTNGWPTLILGREYYIPVVPAVLPVDDGQATAAMEAEFAEMRADMEARLAAFYADLDTFDLDALRDDVEAAQAAAADLAEREDRTIGLARDVRTFIQLIQEDDLDEAAGLQSAIRAIVDDAIAAERASREAADRALGERIDGIVAEDGVIDTRVGSAIDDLRGELFDDQGNLIVPETDVMGILEREGLVEDGTLVIDLSNEPWFNQVFAADGTPLFASEEDHRGLKSDHEDLKKNLGPLGVLPWYVWGPMLLGLIGLVAALVAHVVQRGLRSQVRQHNLDIQENKEDIGELKTLALKDLEWHPGNPAKEVLRTLAPDSERIWFVRPVGTTNWCSVIIGRQADTPDGYVLTDLKRKAGDTVPIDTPFSLQGSKLEFSILKAIKRGALTPEADESSLPEAAADPAPAADHPPLFRRRSAA